MRYDSNDGKVFFSSNESDWALAFDNLPMEVMYPAISLYQRDDKLTLCSSSSTRQKANLSSASSEAEVAVGEGAARLAGARAIEESFISYLESIVARVELLLDQVDVMGEAKSREVVLSHPFLTALLPSLLASVLKCDYKETSPLRSVFRFLPLLTSLARRMATVFEGIAEDVNTIGYCGPVDGRWFIKSSAGGTTVPAQEYTLVMDTVSFKASEPGEDQQEILKPFMITGYGK